MGAGTEAPVSTPCVAIPFEAWPPEKLAMIVTACQGHRNWFGDADYELGEAHRRELVIGRLSDARSRSWETYRNGVFVGILHADEINPGVDCKCHFLFTDRDLHSKKSLCLNTMDWLYQTYKLHILRVEIPTYAAKLTGFVRKALGFKWEAEQRPFSWPSSATPLDADVAKLGSRKHHAILHEGKWHDNLLLSLTRDEFERFKEHKLDRSLSQTAAPIGT